jgi:cellulose synthase/poly-beta-1,6-N-acetylglucosamine synthase-like glycosyltransferase
MEIVFWLSVFLVIYPHFIYPALIRLLARGSRTGKKMIGYGAQGPVALICSVYNEEKVIAGKIDNFYCLDHPNLEMYLGLDGCSDNTLSEIRLAAQDSRVKVFEFPRGGKVNVINSIMSEVWQPYVVMTDANSMFEPDAVTKLMACMNDDVGVVCGRLVLADEQGNSGEGIYWHLETLIKRAESYFDSVIGANGAIYLFKRNLYEPLPPNTINDDFSISMRIFERNYSVVYAEDAVAEERLVTTNSEEFRRHVRDSAGHFRALIYHRRLLNPFRGKRFFFYVSHRVLRWMGPFFLIIALVFNILLALHNPMYRTLLAIHCAGYGLILGTHFMRVRWKPLYIPYYFMLVNSAILMGFIKNMFGLQKTSWESTRR